MNQTYLYLCYFTLGWCLSFTGIAVQFSMIDRLHFSPVTMTMSMGIISSPWCIKPLYGYISDKYGIFDWGKRRPYISITGFLCSFLYIHMRHFIDRKDAFILSLTMISALLCVCDVCADSIIVAIAKKEAVKGDIQTRCWTARASGTLCGAVFSGISYKTFGSIGTFNLCAICPLIMSILVWNLPKTPSPKPDTMLFQKLVTNIKEQRSLAFIFLIVMIAPDYGELYKYFLIKTLHFNSYNLTWMSISGSLSFLLSTITYNRLLSKMNSQQVMFIGIVGGSVFRLTQLLVVTDILPYFWLVLCDGVAEMFFDQLIVMPLIVQAAQSCNKGVEGTLYALLMSICNFSNVLGNWLGGIIGLFFGVTENSFKNLAWVMIIGIICNFYIQMFIYRRIVSVSEMEEEVPLDHLDHMLEPPDPEDCCKQVTLESQARNLDRT